MATPSLIRPVLDDAGLAGGEQATRLRREAMRWSERLLILVGILCVAYYLYVYAEARLYQAFEDRELDKILNSAAVTGTSGASSGTLTHAALPQRTIPAGTTVGRIEVPRLGVSAVIRAGSDARTLRLAVGYIPGTALPGEQGNVGLAGHRDTFFRKLRDINPDDEIRIITKEGVFHYYVQRTSIVMPQDVGVLDPTSYPALTLVTCYPFNYIGSAPKRFIVRAALGTPATLARPIVTKPASMTLTKPASMTVTKPASMTARKPASMTVRKPGGMTAARQTKRSSVHARVAPKKVAARPTISKKRPRITTKVPATPKLRTAAKVPRIK
jgi:sortase A